MIKGTIFMRALRTAVILLPLLATIACADIRQISITNDLTHGIYQDQPVEWWQGEFVTLDVKAMRGGEAITFPTGGVAVFRVWRTNALASLVVDVTGTVQSATGGLARVNLSTTQANVAPSGSNFFGEVAIWDTTNYFGVISSGRITIHYAAIGSNLSYVGESDLLSTVLTNALVSGNGLVTGTVTRSGNQLSFLLDPKPSIATTVQVGSVSAQVLANSNAHNARITTLETGTYALVTANATNAGLQSQIDLKLPTATHASSTATIFAAIALRTLETDFQSTNAGFEARLDAIVSADNALTDIIGTTRLSSTKTNGQAWIYFDATGLATGTPIYSVSGLATGTPIYTVAGLATGTPIYSVAGLATGTPIYSVAGLATGTPIYTVAGLATGTPIYTTAGLATGTPLYVEVGTGTLNAASLSGYATGTPLYVETGTGTLIAASLTGYATTAQVASAVAATTPNAAMSNVFYGASNPSNYQTGAQVATNINARISAISVLASNSVQESDTLFVIEGSEDELFVYGLRAKHIRNGSGSNVFNLGEGSEIPEQTYVGVINELNAEYLNSIPSTGYVTTNGNANGLTNFPATVATSASVTSGDSAVGLVTTNLHLAQGVQITNLQSATASLTSITLTAGANITSATTTANAAVPWLGLTGGIHGVSITNISEQALRYGRTNAIVVGTFTNTVFPWSTNVAFVAGYDDAENIGASRTYWAVGRSKGADNYRGLRWNKTDASWQDIDPHTGATNRLLTTGNFSSSIYWLLAEETAESTNRLRLYNGVVTQNQISVWGIGYQSTTNMWIPLAPGNTTNWVKYEGKLNVY